MSRFFAMRTSDNESEYSSSDEGGGMGGQMQNREQAQAAMLMYDSSSSEEEKRVVRSAKDKRYEALSSTIKVLRNSVKINDWVQALKTFEQLGKVMEKSRNVIQKEGVPRMYIKAISDLEERVNEVSQDKSSKAKMSTANNKALNTLKQKLRKNNKEYERFIAEYRAAPDAHSEEDESASETESESESESEAESKSESEASDEEDESDDDDDDQSEDGATESDFSDFSDESVSSESDIDLSHPAMSRSFWVKKTKGDEEEMTKAERRRQKAPKDKEKKSKQKADQKEEKEIEYTPELIHQKLNAIQSMRGKRGADRYQAIKDLRLLSTKASSVPAILKVKITLMSAMFDLNFNSGTHMQVALWQQACQILDEILAALATNPDVHLIEGDDMEETVFAGDQLSDDNISSLPVIDESKPVLEAGELRTFAPQARRKRDDGQEYVAGSIYSFAARLSDEYIASLQSIDPHTQEYLDRLNDEPALIRLLAKSQQYYESIDKKQFVILLSILRVEYLYVKYDPDFDVQSQSYRQKQDDPLLLLRGEDILLHKLCSLIYQGDDGRSKARAIICTAYHYAMHGHFCKARDVFLMAHIQDSIQQADVSTQILYNRALAMMSVCAFRLGLLPDALNLVADLYATGKIKELLAQGVSQRGWQQDRDTEQEKLERRRQIPYHMHISLDLLESVHLVSAMLLEVPNLAVHAVDDKRHVISRNFRRLWDSFHKNAFNGPPENTRDYVIASAIALSEGDWKLALEHLMQLKMWSLLPFSEVAQASLTKSVKEVALETFLLALGQNYTTISGERLASRFDMSDRDVRAIASRLMANDRLQGAWDAATNSIHMSAIMPNELQLAALHFADQVGVLVEQNERSLEHRHSHGKYGTVGGGKETNTWQSRSLQPVRPRPADEFTNNRRW